MSQTTISATSALQTRFTSPATGPLLVASGASPDSDAALVAASLIAGHTHADVQALTVVTPGVVLGYAYGVMPTTRDIDVAQRDSQLAAVKAQITRVLGSHLDWPVNAEFGEPAQVIAEEASARNARVIVLGRGRHSRTARLLGGEPVLRVLQLGDTPVFAAAAGLEALPRRVVIATDFSELSTYAANVALQFIAPDAEVYLVNVRPRIDASSAGWEQDWSTTYDAGLDDAFRESIDALRRDTLTIEPVSLTGEPAHEVLAFAESKNADLIVSGTHGYGFFRRLILGSVATDLVRNANCSVLSVPGSAHARSALRSRRIVRATTRSYVAHEWDNALREFSERNAGRLCTIEIDHAEIGSQIQGHSIPFVGATHDYHGNMVELMFGEASMAGRHFSNAIPDVNAVDVATDLDGRDRYLRVANPQGQTLIMMT